MRLDLFVFLICACDLNRNELVLVLALNEALSQWCIRILSQWVFPSKVLMRLFLKDVL